MCVLLTLTVTVAGKTDEQVDAAALKALKEELANWLRVPTPGCPASIHDPAGARFCSSSRHRLDELHQVSHL